ncbi:hypothetical protein J2R96_002052 [Bradyrhizobium elkanii]|nr:hypothetical protein [Bradyrhizobium elkanii]
MTSKTGRSFGMLALERGLPPGTPYPLLPGTILDPSVFNFPIIWETAEGACVERVIPGDPTLEPAYVAAARRLVERGAIAIGSTCGFAVRHQRAVAAAVNVPVAMSSLLLLSLLLRQLPSRSKIAVVTYDSTHVGDDLLGIDNRAERARIVVGGTEGSEFWRDQQKVPIPPINAAAVEAEVSACVARLRAANPEIAAIVFECGYFPVAASAIRRTTGLPVYDNTSMCRMLLESIA